MTKVGKSIPEQRQLPISSPLIIIVKNKMKINEIDLLLITLESPSICRDVAEVAETHLDISLVRLADTRLFLRTDWFINGIADAVTTAMAAAPPMASLFPKAATEGDWNVSLDFSSPSSKSTFEFGGVGGDEDTDWVQEWSKPVHQFDVLRLTEAEQIECYM